MKTQPGIIGCLSCIILAVMCMFSCSTKEEKSYRAELEKRGITYDEDTFIGYVARDDYEVAEMFLKAGMSVDSKKWHSSHSANDTSERTPLMLAAYRGNMTLVKLFIDHRAKFTALGWDGTPLMHAVTGTSVIRMVIRHSCWQKKAVPDTMRSKPC